MGKASRTGLNMAASASVRSSFWIWMKRNEKLESDIAAINGKKKRKQGPTHFTAKKAKIDETIGNPKPKERKTKNIQNKKSAGTFHLRQKKITSSRQDRSKSLYPRGITNLGNTCFMSSSLQALAILKEYIHIPLVSHLAILLCQTMQDLKASNNFPIYPINFISEVRRVTSAFTAMSFEDAHEFTQRLLDMVNCSSFIIHGVSKTTCSMCGFISSVADDTFGIQIAIDPHATRNLSHYIKNYLAPEAIDWKCQACGVNYPAMKQTHLIQIPNVLVVQLKHFTWANRTLHKLNSFVECPPLISPLDQGATFELRAVISHEGSVQSGHYYASVKKNTSWFKCNDNQVSLQESKVISMNSYILFYIKISGGISGSG